MFKGTKIYSILTGSCPVCHQESMYIHPNPFKWKGIIKMNDRCGHCDTKYQIEPSFFYGSMYVSYALGVAFAVVAFMLSYVLFESSLLFAFFTIVGVILFFMPMIMRLSRNIWINIFMHYDPKHFKS